MFLVAKAVEEKLSVDLEVTNMVTPILLMYQVGYDV